MIKPPCKENHSASESCTKKSLKPTTRVFGTDITTQNAQIYESKLPEPRPDHEEIISDIYRNLHDIESSSMPISIYMKSQNFINAKMRATLIDWLFEVHLKFDLQEETLFLTTNLLDRYLSTTIIPKESLQLIGVTSMFLACKYEEIHPPDITDFVVITQNSYQKKEIIQTERAMLKALEYNLTVPTAYTFYQRYSRICKLEEVTYCIGLYLIEVSLEIYEFLKYKPSMIAASAVYLSKKIANKSKILRKSEAFEASSDCTKDMIKVVKGEFVEGVAVRKKFESDTYRNVSETIRL